MKSNSLKIYLNCIYFIYKRFPNFHSAETQFQIICFLHVKVMACACMYVCVCIKCIVTIKRSIKINVNVSPFTTLHLVFCLFGSLMIAKLFWHPYIPSMWHEIKQNYATLSIITKYLIRMEKSGPLSIILYQCLYFLLLCK